MLAILNTNYDLTQLLIDRDTDPKLVGKDNRTALMVAAGVAYNDHIKGTEAEALEAVKLWPRPKSNRRADALVRAGPPGPAPP
jgi:hypothetical protein